MKTKQEPKLDFAKAFQQVKGLGGLAPKDQERVKKAKFVKALKGR